MKKVLAIVLVVAMLFGMIPTGAVSFATDLEQSGEMLLDEGLEKTEDADLTSEFGDDSSLDVFTSENGVVTPTGNGDISWKFMTKDGKPLSATIRKASGGYLNITVKLDDLQRALNPGETFLGINYSGGGIYRNYDPQSDGNRLIASYSYLKADSYGYQFTFSPSLIPSYVRSADVVFDIISVDTDNQPHWSAETKEGIAVPVTVEFENLSKNDPFQRWEYNVRLNVSDIEDTLRSQGKKLTDLNIESWTASVKGRSFGIASGQFSPYEQTFDNRRLKTKLTDGVVKMRFTLNRTGELLIYDTVKLHLDVKSETLGKIFVNPNGGKLRYEDSATANVSIYSNPFEIVLKDGETLDGLNNAFQKEKKFIGWYYEGGDAVQFPIAKSGEEIRIEARYEDLDFSRSFPMDVFARIEGDTKEYQILSTLTYRTKSTWIDNDPNLMEDGFITTIPEGAIQEALRDVLGNDKAFDVLSLGIDFDGYYDFSKNENVHTDTSLDQLKKSGDDYEYEYVGRYLKDNGQVEGGRVLVQLRLEKKPVYTVRFHSGSKHAYMPDVDGKPVNEREYQVVAGQVVGDFVPEPTLRKYIFTGWEVNGKPFDPQKDVVDGNVVATAQYKKVDHFKNSGIVLQVRFKDQTYDASEHIRTNYTTNGNIDLFKADWTMYKMDLEKYVVGDYKNIRVKGVTSELRGHYTTRNHPDNQKYWIPGTNQLKDDLVLFDKDERDDRYELKLEVEVADYFGSIGGGVILVELEADPAYYYVTFDSNGGTFEGNTTVRVSNGGKLDIPQPPKKIGHQFLYWAIDSEDGEAFNFSQPIVSNLKLVAKYQMVVRNVTLDPKEGNLPEKNRTYTALDGMTIQDEVLRPTRLGYRFVGWEKTDGSIFHPERDPVNEDLLLVAKYEKLDQRNGFGVGIRLRYNGKIIALYPGNESYVSSTISDKGDVRTYRFNASLNKRRVEAVLEPDLEFVGITGYTVESLKGHYTFKGSKENEPYMVSPDSDELKPSLYKVTYREINKKKKNDRNHNVSIVIDLHKDYGQVESGIVTFDIEVQSKIKHQVTFNPNGGTLDGSTEVKEVEVRDGKLVAKPNDPARDGYRFLYWAAGSENGDPYSFDALVKQNLNLVAKYVKIHKVIMNAKGGYLPSQNTVYDVESGQKIEGEVLQPTKQRHVFTGWLVDGNPFDPKNDRILSDVTAVAQYERLPGYNGSGVELKLRYNGNVVSMNVAGNGGIVSKASSTKEGKTTYFYQGKLRADMVQKIIGSDYIFKNFVSMKAETVRAHYTFKNSKANEAYMVSPAGDELKAEYYEEIFTGDQAVRDFKLKVTLEEKSGHLEYASLIVDIEVEPAKKTYKVTFNPNGGTLEGEKEVEVKDGKTVEKPKDPVRKGHKFLYWAVGSEDGEEFKFDTPIEADLKLVAKYEIGEFTVTFDPGEGKMRSTLVGVKPGKRIPANVIFKPTWRGHLFTGWTVDGESFDPDNDVVNRDTHAVAQYTDLPVKNGAGFVVRLKVDGKLIPLDGIFVTSKGIKYDGVKHVDVATFESNIDEARIVAAINDDVELVKIKGIEVVAMGHFSHKGHFLNAGYMIMPELKIFKKEYVSVVRNINGKSATPVIKVQMQKDFGQVEGGTITVELEVKQKHTVTLDLDGGTFAGQTVFKVADGEVFKQPSVNPYIAGHRFLGWYLSDTLYDFSSKVTSDITLVAKYIKIGDQKNWGFHVYLVTPDGERTELDQSVVKRIQVRPDGAMLEHRYEVVSTLDNINAVLGTKWELVEIKNYVVKAVRRALQIEFPIDPTLVNTIGLSDDKLLNRFYITLSKEQDILGGDIEIFVDAIDNTKPKHTITFNPDGGEYDGELQVVVPDGRTLAEPKVAPTKAWHTFIEWQKDGVKYNFTDPVTASFELKAFYEELPANPEVKHTVTFDPKGGLLDGSADVKTVEVVDNTAVAEPSTPVKANHKFLYWALEGETTAYDFDTAITQDITLVAMYDKLPEVKHTVTFDPNGGMLNGSTTTVVVEVEENQLVSQPTNPTKDGHKFIEWRKDGAAYNFDSFVTESFKLVAYYEKENTGGNDGGNTGGNTGGNDNTGGNTGGNDNTGGNTGTGNNQGTTDSGVDFFPDTTTGSTGGTTGTVEIEEEGTPLSNVEKTDDVLMNGEKTSLKIGKDGTIVVTEADLKDVKDPILLSFKLENGDHTHVTFQKEGEKNIVIPISVYLDGRMHVVIAGPGTYVAKEAPASFRGVPEKHWGIRFIQIVGARQLMVGNEHGDFMPDVPTTRAMFTQILARLQKVDLTSVQSNHYADVPMDKWYAASVNWATDQGIVNGVGGGKFAPEDAITREQMAVMIYHYLKLNNWKLAMKAGATQFADYDLVSGWAKDAVTELKDYGIFEGKPGHKFDPKANATRAEVATVVARLLELYIKSLQMK